MVSFVAHSRNQYGSRYGHFFSTRRKYCQPLSFMRVGISWSILVDLYRSRVVSQLVLCWWLFRQTWYEWSCDIRSQSMASHPKFVMTLVMIIWMKGKCALVCEVIKTILDYSNFAMVFQIFFKFSIQANKLSITITCFSRKWSWETTQNSPYTGQKG